MRTFVLVCLTMTAGWSQSLKSPDGATEIAFAAGGGRLTYTVNFHGKPVVTRSALGLELAGEPVLGGAVRITGSHTGSIDDSYAMPHGKSNPVRNRCATLALDLEETGAPNRKFNVEARAYNDGVAFRYVVPRRSGVAEVRLVSEKTEFRLAKDATTYPLILDGFQTSYEDDYQTMPLSGIHSSSLIALPLLTELPGVAWVAITEADIEDYAGMYLKHSGSEGLLLTATLSPSLQDVGLAVRTAAPMHSPWRVLMIGDQPGRLVESNIVINLNPTSAIADTSWIKPGKTAWDWWSGSYAEGVNFKPGMNTATMNHYVDFCAEAGLPYMLIDEGWSKKGTISNHSGWSLTETNPDIDLPAILAHAKEKNVRIWLWAHWADIEKQLDDAFPLYEKWGIAGVKIDFMNRDDQWMVNYYHRVVEKAAAHHLMIDYHGAYKPDGMRRTWPNLVTREGVMGAEYNKWSARVTADHNVMLAFTRMLAGPLDYTPGGFGNATREQFESRMTQPMVMTTRAHQLALYVVYESGLQMLADFPEAYKGKKELDFLRAVPVAWDETRVLGGKPGEYIAIARRSGNEWYIGCIAGSHGAQIELPLGFLSAGNYTAEIYADGDDAAANPRHATRDEKAVSRDASLHVKMVPTGGQAIRIHPR